jgi:hypothetical protein
VSEEEFESLISSGAEERSSRKCSNGKANLAQSAAVSNRRFREAFPEVCIFGNIRKALYFSLRPSIAETTDLTR